MPLAPEPPLRAQPFWRDRWILGGICVFVAFRVLYYFNVAARMSPLGDEVFYYSSASVIVRIAESLLRGDVSSAVALASQLVDRGWFLPGMSIVLAPVRAVTDSVALARLYMGVLNSLLFWFGAWRLARMYGLVPARIAVALVAIFPYHAAFCFTFWGDLVAGHGLLILLVVLAETQREIQHEGQTSGRRIFLIGAATIGLVYVRPNLTLLVPSTTLCLFLFHLQVLRWPQAVWRSAGAGVMITGIVALGLFPWSYSVSRRFGGMVVTTTSVDVNIIYAFGPSTWRPHIAPGQNPWSFIFDAVRKEAESRGAPFATVSGEWRSEVIDSLTLPSYAAAVRDNLSLFFLDEAEFLERFASPDFRTRGKATDFGAFNRLTIALNGLMWRAALLFCLLTLLLPWRLVGLGWWLGLLYRVAFCAIAAQTFLSDTNGRSYIMLVPLIAATLGLTPFAISAVRQHHASGAIRQNDRVFRCFEWTMPAAIALALATVSF